MAHQPQPHEEERLVAHPGARPRGMTIESIRVVSVHAAAPSTPSAPPPQPQAAPAASGAGAQQPTSPVKSGPKTREYEHSRFDADPDAVKHAWEAAPSGRVCIYETATGLAAALPMKRESTLREFDREPSDLLHVGADPGHQGEGVPKDQLSGEFYIPGISHKVLGPWRATSIAGNDITSSCLYTSGLIATSAGINAPIASILVVFVLYLFRSIYTESCTALPMNGGTYNILLNTTGKIVAALAAVLTLLSYTATAVVSASSAADYVNFQWPFLPPEWMSIGVMVAFALLTLLGVKDSANAALAIFVFHLATMGGLIVAGLYYGFSTGWGTLYANYHSDSPAANPHGDFASNLFHGFCAALLGVSGFESSSNYIEEQKPRVFAITLRNMWIAVSILNPVLTVLMMAVLGMDTIVKHSDFSLALMAHDAVGPWLRTIVVVDAFLVLAGSVLTSFVGVTGLMRRLSLDHILPKILLQTNSFRGTNHWIIFAFMLLTCSLRLLVSDMSTLAGVYSIAFLGVMSLFTVGTLVLKHKRSRLPREVITPVWQCFLALTLVLIGFFGNIVKGKNAIYFGMYGIIFATAVVTTTKRVSILRLLYQALHKKFPNFGTKLESAISEARKQPIVFFTRAHTISTLNKVIQYVITNEETKTLMFAHFFQNEEDPAEQEYMKYLEDSCSILDKIYLKITIQLVFVKGQFSPANVAELSEELGVPRYFMFMSCPSNRFPHQLGHFGGVRVVTH